jgi:DNA-binding response OmpR family regulator
MEQPPPPYPSRTRCRVLVIDDDRDTLVMLGRLLSKIAVDAIPTTSYASARYALATLGPFDIVIADQELGDGNGVQLAVEAKGLHRSATVVVSGHDFPVTGLPPGIDLWIRKPVELAGLQRAVQTLCKA